MDNLQPAKADNFKPRTLMEVLRENRGSTEAPAEPAAPPVGDPSLQSPLAPATPPETPPVTPDPAAAPEAAPAAAPAVKAWYDGINSTDIKNHPKIQEFKDVDGLAKSFLELHSLMGHKKVALPNDEADEVAIAHLHKALGVPEEAKGYELQEPEPIEGMEQAQFGMDEFKELAHKHKLTPKQAEGVLADYTAMITGIRDSAIKELKENVEKSKADLTKEWGMAYDAKVQLAQSVMNKFAGSKENFDHINSIIGADPIALKWLATIGDNFKEGSIGPLGNQNQSFTKTPAEAKTEYDKIMSDPNDPYWAGVRNNQIVSEPVRKARISYVEGLLRMQQPR